MSLLSPDAVVCETVKLDDPGLAENPVLVLATAIPAALVLKATPEAVVASDVATGSTRSRACEGSERYNCL